MNPSFLSQEPWGWSPDAVGQVSFVTAKRLYLDPARKQNAPANPTTPAPVEAGWDWRNGPPPKADFVAELMTRGKTEEQAVAIWERLSNGQVKGQ